MTFLCCVAVLVGVAVVLHGQEIIGYGPPEYVLEPASFAEAHITAGAWIVFDAETGIVFESVERTTVRPLASVTKFVTAATAMRIADLESTTTVSWRAVGTEGRAGNLRAGDTLTIRELLFPLLLESSNDAAEAIAEHVGRDPFIANMNAYAAELGMENSSFYDPSGLSFHNVSTAEDLRLLTMALYRDHRYVLDITRLPRYAAEHQVWQNAVPVASEAGYRGGKNGFTDEAGRTLLAVFDEEFSSGSRPIGIVLLGSTDVRGDTAALRAAVHAGVDYRDRWAD